MNKKILSAPTKDKTLQIRVTMDTYKRLIKRSKQFGTQVSTLVRYLIEKDVMNE